MITSHARTLASWFLGLCYDDLPKDVVANIKLHILDALGLMLVVSTQEYGCVLREAVLSMGTGRGSHIVGFGNETAPALAVIANGGMADALDYDDTHNETHLHPGAHVVPTALTVGESRQVSGRELLVAVAGGMELGCRMAVTAPGMFIKYGLHSSSVIGAMTTTFIASRLLGLSLDQTCNALGTAGSQAGGILACYDDGTWTQALHPGWAAHSGISAALLGKAGFLGPQEVLEGRWGLFRTHIQDTGYEFDFERMLADLGGHWENRHISLKLYPTGCVIHPYLDAILYLHREAGLRAADVDEIVMPVSPHWIGVICEPVERKLRPATEIDARISLNYAVAEALYFGALGLDNFTHANLTDPEILSLAAKSRYVVDENPPPRRSFNGKVMVRTKDGRVLERAETDWTKGHHDNPETPRLIEEKFRENAERALHRAQVEAIVTMIGNLEAVEDVSALARLLCRSTQCGF